jgi:regulator of protease activity HflC (stomatin/prohibitin superfamily)
VVGGNVVDGVGQNWTVILGTLGIALVAYLLGSLRVLWQYGRGVVFLLGEFEGVRGLGLTKNLMPP